MTYLIFLPIFGLLGVLIRLQAVEITRLKERVTKLETQQVNKNKKEI